MKYIVYADGIAYGFFCDEAEAWHFAEKELPVNFRQGNVKVAKFEKVRRA